MSTKYVEREREVKEKVIVAEVKVARKITEQDLSDMLTTAFEGGITYWCDKVKATKFNKEIPEEEFLADDIASGHVTEIQVFDNEEEDDNGKPKKYVVTRDKMLEAFQLMADKAPHHMKDFLDDNCDAITGDVWFQLAVFGEVIYG